MKQTIVFRKDCKCFQLFRCPYDAKNHISMDPFNRLLFTGKYPYPTEEYHYPSKISNGVMIFPRYGDNTYEEMCRFFHFDPETSKDGDIVYMELMACYTGDGRLILFKKGSSMPKRAEGVFKSRCKTVKEFCERWIYKGPYHVRYWKFDKGVDYIVTDSHLDSMGNVNPYLYESNRFDIMKWYSEQIPTMIDIAYNMDPVDLSESYDYTDEQKKTMAEFKERYEKELEEAEKRRRLEELERWGKIGQPGYCEECGREGADFVEDPLDEEMLGHGKWRWLCRHCYEELCLNI